jgi:hypothetical protein
MLLEVIENENSVLHKKCLQYRFMTQELLDRHLLLERRLENYLHMEDEFMRLKALHSVCLSEEEIEVRVSEAIEKALSNRREKLEERKKELEEASIASVSSKVDSELMLQEVEAQKLKDAIIKMAVASKELSQVSIFIQILIASVVVLQND